MQKKNCKGRPGYEATYVSLTSVVVHMLPDTSMQKTTREPAAILEFAPLHMAEDGCTMYRIVFSTGTSSGTISTSFSVPQNSHSHSYGRSDDAYAKKK